MQSCHESISSSILMYLILRRATCTSVPLPQDSAAGRYKPPQGAAGHCKVMLLRRLVVVIDVMRHSCCQDDWQLTELNYTYSKNSNNITRNSVLRRSVASCGHWTDRWEHTSQKPNRRVSFTGNVWEVCWVVTSPPPSSAYSCYSSLPWQRSARQTAIHDHCTSTAHCQPCCEICV